MVHQSTDYYNSSISLHPGSTICARLSILSKLIHPFEYSLAPTKPSDAPDEPSNLLDWLVRMSVPPVRSNLIHLIPLLFETASMMVGLPSSVNGRL